MTTTRPLIVGPDAGPESPYPLRMEGRVISGFGRGSKELGIPTANLPVGGNDASPGGVGDADADADANANANGDTNSDGATAPEWLATAASGVYFGWASLALPADHPDTPAGAPGAFAVHPMVMSIGYNPFYANTVRSAEVHVLRHFARDFYGVEMRLLILAFVRAERGDYDGVDALVRDIRTDCDVARASLDRPAWRPREVDAAGTLDGSWLVR